MVVPATPMPFRRGLVPSISEDAVARGAVVIGCRVAGEVLASRLK